MQRGRESTANGRMERGGATGLRGATADGRIVRSPRLEVDCGRVDRTGRGDGGANCERPVRTCGRTGLLADANVGEATDDGTREGRAANVRALRQPWFWSGGRR